MKLETRELVTIVTGRDEAYDLLDFLRLNQSHLSPGASKMKALLEAHFDERVGH